MHTKTLIAVTAALALGFILGGLAPRRDLDHTRREMDKIQKQLAQTKRQTPLDSFADAVLSRNTDKLSSTTRPVPGDQADTVGIAVKSDTAESPETNARERRRRSNRPTLAEIIKRQSDILKVRSNLRRNQMINKEGLTVKEVAMFDEIITAMNNLLAEEVRVWTDFVAEKDFINEEMRLRMVNDFSAIIVSGYDSLYQAMPETWLAQRDAENEFEMQDFIDPEVFLPMTNISDHLQPWPRTR